MTKKEQIEQSTILLVKLSNRLSYYLRYVEPETKTILVTKDTPIEELQKLLDKFYQEEDERQKIEESKPKIKLKYKNKQA